MKADELKLITQMIELTGEIGKLKGECDALKRENEFLRGMLSDKLKELREAPSSSTE